MEGDWQSHWGGKEGRLAAVMHRGRATSSAVSMRACMEAWSMGCKGVGLWRMSMAKGLLLAAFDFSSAHADEFHDWYDLEHIPERQRVPGFGACERWIGEDQPSISVATYDLAGIDVLSSDA